MARPTARASSPSRGRFSRRGPLVLLALLAVVAGAWSGGTALAHAEVIEVVPASNTVLPDAPTEVTVRFSEPVSLSGGAADVFDDTGEAIPTEASVTDSTLTIDLPDTLADGTYVVSWRVISADSHPISGTSVFSVGAPSTSAPVSVDAGPEIPAIVSGWRVLAMAATYAGVLVTVGLWWFARRWYGVHTVEDTGQDTGQDTSQDTGDGPDGDAERGHIADALHRLDRWRFVAAVTGIVGLLLAFPARLVTVGGGWDALSDGTFVTDTLTGPIGQATFVTIVGVVGLLVVRPSRANIETITLGLIASLAALGGFALEGHTRTKEPTWLIVVSDVVHTAAGSVWLGGVVALAVVLRRVTGAWRARVVLDVSSSALWAVVAVSIAGVAMSLVVMPTFNALADTGYGLALLVKVALVVVLVAIGARNRLVLVPAITESAASGNPDPADRAVRSLRRSVALELAVFAALLVATATLVGRSPVVASDEPSGQDDGEHGTAGVAEPVTVPLSTGVGSVTITLDPGEVGGNMLMLTLTDEADAPLTVIEPPTVELREATRGIGPLALVPEDIGNSTYHVITDIPFSGTWEVSVRARTSTFDSGVATTEFLVQE